MPFRRIRPPATYLCPSLRKQEAIASIGPAVIRAWHPAWPVVYGGPVGSLLAGVPGGSRWKVSMFTRTRLTFWSDAETSASTGPPAGPGQ